MALTYGEVRLRREKLDGFLKKSITDPKVLAEKIGCSIHTVRYDIKYKQKKNLEYILALKNDGYIHSTNLAMSQIQDIIEELQKLRNDEEFKSAAQLKVKLQLHIIIAELITQVWAMEGDGIKLATLIQEDDREIEVPQEVELIKDNDKLELDDTQVDIKKDILNDTLFISSADQYEEDKYDQYDENYEPSQ